MNPNQVLHEVAQLAQQGQLDLAQKKCRAFIEKFPANLEGQKLYGMILSNLGNHADAARHLMTVVLFGPPDVDVLFDLADALTASEQYAAACVYYFKAIGLAPSSPELHFNLGFVTQRLDRHMAAVQSYEQALRLRPDWIDAHNNIGLSLIELDRPEEAAAHFRKVLSLEPNHLYATNNLGLALADLDRFDEAIQSYKRAVEMKPDYFEAHNNMGWSLMELRRYDDALRQFQKSSGINPAYHRAIYNESVALLSIGDLPDGLRKYESRWNTPRFPNQKPVMDCPQWVGDEDLSGKSIFVYAEQGLGDTIQFCRYLPLLAAKTGQATVEVPENLQNLLATLDGKLALVTPGGVPAGYDFHIPMCSLPLAFKTATGTIPAAVPYLAVPSESASKFADVQRTPGALNIGICWRSGSRHRLMKKRDMALGSLLKALKSAAPSTRVFSLQKEATADELKSLAAAGDIADLGGRFADFSDTAAAIAQMDLVISVDTSVAHLCGALGIPVWIALMYSPDWRWLPANEQSAWYPSARLFRQSAIGDWANVVAEISTALPAFTAKPG